MSNKPKSDLGQDDFVAVSAFQADPRTHRFGREQDRKQWGRVRALCTAFEE